jgi:hypothetical protein
LRFDVPCDGNADVLILPGENPLGFSEAGGPSRLYQVAAMSVVLGTEQAWAGGCEGVAGERVGHILRRKEAVPVSISNQPRLCCATVKPGGGSSNQSGVASRQRKSVQRGADCVQEDARAEGRMLRPAKRLPRWQW